MSHHTDLLQLVALGSELGLEVGDHVEGGSGIQRVLCVVHGAQVQGVVVAVQQLLHQGLVVNHPCGLGVVLHPCTPASVHMCVGTNMWQGRLCGLGVMLH